MVKPEQDRQEDRKRDCEEDVAHADVPEMDEPPSLRSREEGFARRQLEKLDVRHLADVDEAGEEDDGQWRSIVLDELPNVTLEK